MTNKRVEIQVNGKVVVDADVTKAQQKIATLSTGAGAPVPGAAPGVIGGGGAPAGPPVPVIGAGGIPRADGSNAPMTAGQRQWLENTAWRTMQAANGSLASARTEADFRRLGDRIERATGYATGAGNEQLIKALQDLRRTMDEKQAAIRGAGAGTPPPGGTPPAPPAPEGNARPWVQNVAGWLGQQGGNTVLGGVGRFLGGGAATALFGSAIGRLLTGPAGIALGGMSAANFAFNAISNNVTEANAPARNEIGGYADLARQYGVTKDLLPSFRDANGWSNARFSKLGYTATAAAHIASLYDRPGGSERPDAMMNDTESILRFSRSTGVDESRAAGLTQVMGRAGIGGPYAGSADDTLRTLKLAMTEGVKQGIAQSETMNALSGAVARNTSRGMSSNDTALAYYANILRRTNDPRNTNPMLRGEQGLNVMTGFMNGIGQGGNDDGIDYMLSGALVRKGLPSAMSAGMSVKGQDGEMRLSDEGIAYEGLRGESPLEAARYLMGRAASGKNPQIMKMLTETVDGMAGNSIYLKKMLYKQLNPEASDEQIMSLIGGGGLSEYVGGSANAQAIQRQKNGESLLKDPQGNNYLANQSMFIGVAQQDRELLKSLSSLNLSAGLEGWLSDAKNYFGDLRANLSRGVGGEFGQAGDVSGAAGSGWKNPSSTWQSLPGADGSGAGTGPRVGAPGAARNAPVNVAGGANTRTLSAVAAVESASGTSPQMNVPGKAAMGMFQMQSKWLIGKGGWAAEAGVDMRNPDGSPVTTEAQARAWQVANPDAANRIAASRLGRIEGGVRAYAGAQGQTLTDAQAAALTGVVWHANGGGNIGAMSSLPVTARGNPLNGLTHKNGQLITDVRFLKTDRGDGVTDGDYYTSAYNAFQRPDLPGVKVGAAPTAGGGLSAWNGSNTGGLNKTFGGKIDQLFSAWQQANPGGLTPTILEGFRSNERQQQLYNQSRDGSGRPWATNAQAGESPHNHGLGVDVGWIDPKTGKRLDPNDPRSIAALKQMAVMAQGVGGLAWLGGMGDLVHFEAAGFDGKKAKGGVLPKGYASGGYTGDGARDSVAGQVHGQEFVVNAAQTARYRPMLEQLNAGGGAGSTVQVNVGGVVQVQAQISAPAQAQIEARTSAYRRDIGEIVRVDLQSHRGVR